MSVQIYYNQHVISQLLGYEVWLPWPSPTLDGRHRNVPLTLLVHCLNLAASRSLGVRTNFSPSRLSPLCQALSPGLGLLSHSLRLDLGPGPDSRPYRDHLRAFNSEPSVRMWL